MRSRVRRGAVMAGAALLIVSVATRAWAATPVIDSVSPQPVEPGATLHVVAHGFTPNAPSVGLVWDNAEPPFATTTADGSGNIAVDMVVPSGATDGDHDLGVCDNASPECNPATIGHKTVAVATVPPHFTSVTPQPVDAGGSLNLVGDHFAASQPIEFYWNNFASDLGSVSSSAAGTVNRTVTVPAGTSGGTYELEACRPTGGTSPHCIGGDASSDVVRQSVVVASPTVPVATTIAPHIAATTTTVVRPSTTTSTSTSTPPGPATPTAESATTVPLRQAQVALPAPRSSPHVLAVYNPAAHARDVVKLLVGAFTLMTIALAGGGTLATAGGRAAAVARRSSGKVGSTKVKHYKERWPGEKPGDGSRLWRWPGTASLDRISVGLPARVAPASPLLARLLTDGSYLRSMLGSLWVALPFSALGLGAAAVADVHGHALPPNEGLVIALCVVGVLDTFAGFVGALVFATGVLVSGGVGGADGARTLMGLGAIWFAAPLVASAARPLRRPPSVTREQRWDRGADFVIAALIAAWAIQKMVGGLPGLSGFDLPIVSRADVIALAVLAAMVIRMALESVAASLFPKRLETVQPERLPYAPSVQRLAAAAVRTAIFVFVAVAFIGVRWQLFAGATLFVIPQVLTVYEHRFPNFDRLYRGLPKGIVKSVLMLAVGVVAGILIFHRHRPPADLIADAFVLLSLPGFALSLLDLVGREGPGHEMHWRARFAGVAVLAAGIALALR